MEQQHRQLVAATLPQLGPGAVLSHGSAAVLHGLPVWPHAVQRVHLTRSRNYGAKRRSLVEVHAASLPPGSLAMVTGMPVTSLARTVADLARTLPAEQAVAAGDRALAGGLDEADLHRTLLAMQGWPNLRKARRAIDLLDRRSESPGESISRVRIAEDGLPAPELQREIFDGNGRLVGRVDFCWEEQRTIGEFDGKIKYGRLLKPGQSSTDVLFDEKRREDAMRDLGWQVVRWLWEDLYRPGLLRARVLRAFARSA